MRFRFPAPPDLAGQPHFFAEKTDGRFAMSGKSCYFALWFNSNNDSNMKKYVCTVCGYVYDPAVGDPDSGIEPGTAFEDIPADWVCPLCGVGKDDFEVSEE